MTDIRENYGKVIESMFSAVKVNKQTILNGADPDEVWQASRTQSVKLGE